tara:strand:+ start:111 stop:728 length:618 start_codon:yes stop_codon:yes gene_type:complete
MSRLKSYYTVAEIELNLYTTGQEFMTIDRKNYIGLYHAYKYTGEIYTNSTFTKTSKKLITYEEIAEEASDYKKLRPKIKTKYKIPKSYKVQLTVDTIKQGFLNRYFIKKINSNNVIEIDNAHYKDYTNNKIDPNLYQAALVKWIITGEVNDTTSNGIFTPGAYNINKQTIEKLDQTFSGISQLITNFTEYFTDTDFVISKDINPI